MMKLALRITLLASALSAACAGDAKETPPPDARVAYQDIVYAVEIGGRLVPREEVFVRPLVSGLLAEVRVRAGERVKKGHHLATVRVVADPVMLAEARAASRRAATSLATATRELTRLRAIEGGTGITARELAQAEDAERIARSDQDAADERARLIAQGVAGALKPGELSARSTHVFAPVDGTVLAVPVAVGDFVSDSNSYRDGTAIAILADMDAMVFKGFVEEAHVGRLSIGMPARISVGALGGAALDGTLRWIAPRASIEAQPGAQTTLPNGQPVIAPLTASTSGSTRFELWVDVTPRAGAEVRAGYTASAEFVLDRREHVLAVPEVALRFTGGKAFADVRTATGSEPHELSLGISNGTHVEVQSGLSEGDRLVPPTKL